MDFGIDPCVDRNEEDSKANEDPLELVRRISVSKHLARSPRLAALLLFLCKQTVSGQATSLTESLIASEVFGRKGRFDAYADTIVRSHMVRLRQKLALYFKEEGAEETVRISIPRGGYAPLLEYLPLPSGPINCAASESIVLPSWEHLNRTPQPTEPTPEMDPNSRISSTDLQEFSTSPTSAKRSGHHANRKIGWGIAIALVVIVFLSAILFHSQYRVTMSGSNELWAQMLPPSKSVMLIAADSSLVLMHVHMSHDTSLADYTSGRYLDDLRASQRAGVDTLGLEDRRYTSIVDLEMTRWLTQLAVEHGALFEVRYPRDVSLQDVKKENLIISGSLGANPWLELFEPMLNFNIMGIPERHIMIVTNRSPRVGEQKEYTADQPPIRSTYGVLAFLPGPDPSKNVLILQGTSIAGTEAICDLVFDHQQLDPMLRDFRRPDGTLSHFEILLSGQHVNASSVRFTIVASRVITK